MGLFLFIKYIFSPGGSANQIAVFTSN